VDHYSTEETEEIGEINEAIPPIASENIREPELTSVHGDQRVWIKPPDVLFTDQIKEEVPEYEYETIIEVKDEIEEIKEDIVKIEPTKNCEPIKIPPLVDVEIPKVVKPKIYKKKVNKRLKKPTKRVGLRPRPILPMTQPIASVSTSHLEQVSTPHQIIMPSTQMAGIAYQIFLGDHSKNSNNPVQYTMLQPQSVFLQQNPTSVSTSSSVVISQPYQMTQAQIPAPKIPKIAPKIVGQSYCSFCYQLFNNINGHIKDCWLNPDSKSYKFRKIAPSTPL